MAGKKSKKSKKIPQAPSKSMRVIITRTKSKSMAAAAKQAITKKAAVATHKSGASSKHSTSQATPKQSRFASSPQEAIQRQSTTHLDEFFAKYPTFSYSRSQPVMQQFYRMCDFFRWERDDKQRGDARSLLGDAMSKQFNNLYGTDVGDINSWRKLCRVLEISPIPQTLDACRNAVLNTHVNIVDLLDTRRTGLAVVRFESEQMLSTYTKKWGKFFSADSAYAGGLLRFLLRHIMNPRSDNNSKDDRGGGKRGRG